MVTNTDTNDISVFLNNGNFTFFAHATSTSVALANLNGDSKPEVIVLNQSSTDVSVLLNQTP